MLKERSILIGCDDPLISPMLLSSINKQTTSFIFNVITVTTLQHFKGILKSLNSDLIILFFANNKTVLAEIKPDIKNLRIPVLCLLNKYETPKEYLYVNNNVFTYPLEHINNHDYLNSKIHSLFFLEADTSSQKTGICLADAAYQKPQTDNNRNLGRYVLELDQKVEILSIIKKKIAGLSSIADNPVKAELLSIVNGIKRAMNNKELWNDFKLFYEEADPNFLLALAIKYPFLTPIDLKYCCYLKMNMTNDDIRKICGISLESVRTHKHRLKKKMTLAKEQDLGLFLRSIH
ncbi:MAG: hypothetical protein IPP72_16830 [Chitinophagaceae bacterium]|nr:hypothetical protein [Chitinophagaceae bacterium]